MAQPNEPQRPEGLETPDQRKGLVVSIGRILAILMILGLVVFHVILISGWIETMIGVLGSERYTVKYRRNSLVFDGTLIALSALWIACAAWVTFSKRGLLLSRTLFLLLAGVIIGLLSMTFLGVANM